MRHIPNLDYRFEELMHNMVELCVCSIEPRSIAFVCMPRDAYYIHSRISNFMRDRRYGVTHYVSSTRRDPALYFENKSGIAILAHEDEWLGATFTDIVMFCRLDEMHEDTALCLRSCIYCCSPTIFSMLSRYPSTSTTFKKIHDREAEKA